MNAIFYVLFIPLLGTVIGSALVFFIKKEINSHLQKTLLGFASGVMIAASVWSLLLPSISIAEENGNISWIPASVGFLLGIFFLLFLDLIIPHLHNNEETPEGPKSNFKKSTMLILAVTLHNIPEGMAVGVAFGSLLVGLPNASLISAIMLAFGIGIQNFPEGLCAAIPLYKNGMSKHKAFFYGQISGIVEPIFGLLGILFAITIQNILPVLLSFSAGAMIAVVALELIPTAFKDNKILAAIGLLIGFTTMMILDISLS